MLNVWLAADHLYGKRLFTYLSLVMYLMVPYFVLSFSHEMSWMRSGTEMNQFLRVFLPTDATFPTMYRLSKLHKKHNQFLRVFLLTLPTMYRLSKLHKKHIKHDIANSSSCTTSELSKLFNFLPHCCQNPCHNVL